ncbi:alpha/beta hydrolase [Bacteroidales bacterium OttesenSCG-928-I14]|nr:alpha/beta hydrolase [Bacteroidales bacterium OttesenSCG-928-I14]
MKKYLFLLCFIISSFILIAGEEAVVLKTPVGDIYGTLRVPETSQSVPVALIIAGSGPTDRDGNNAGMTNNSLKMLALGLNDNNIATLNFDKRMIGESFNPDFKEEDFVFDDMVSDVKGWIDMLSEDKRFSEIIVIGHSEGSSIGMIASENNPKVNKYISLAGIADSADEILKVQLAAQSEKLLEVCIPYIDQLKRGEYIEDVPQNLYSLFRPSVQPYMISLLKYTPTEIMKNLDIPVLIINGTTDFQVGTDQADKLAEANPKAQKLIIENMNHVLKEAEVANQFAQMPVYMNPELPLKEELIPAITKFVLQ